MRIGRPKIQENTVYVGNLDDKVTEQLLYELITQAAPVTGIYMPRDKVTNERQNYGFVELQTRKDAEYVVNVMNGIRLYNQPIRLDVAISATASGPHAKPVEVGANLFVGSLHKLVTENMLDDAFSQFGELAGPPTVMRDAQTGESKGYGFVRFTSFDAADRAISEMNRQYLMNRQITVSYAFKESGKKGQERHGGDAERKVAKGLLAS